MFYNKSALNIFILFVLFLVFLFNFNTIVVQAVEIDEIPTIVMKDGQTKIESEDGIVKETNSELWTEIFHKYRKVIAGAVGFATLTLIGMVIVNLSRLATSSDNPSEREKAKKALLHSAIPLVGLGAITFIVGLAFNFL